MEKKFNRIGIIDRSSSGWAAGESYTKSILRSLLPFCRESGTDLLLFTSGGGTAFRTFVEVKIVPFELTGSKDGLVDAINREKPSVLFPVLDDPVHRMDVPSIAWIPDLQHRFLPQFFPAAELAYRDQLFQVITSQTAFTVTSSEASRRALIQSGLGSAETAKALPFPSSLIDTDFSEEPFSVLQKYSLPGKFALIANQFWKHKNHEVVIRAMALLREQIPDLVLVLTGLPVDFRDPTNSTLSSLLQQIARASLQNQVIILGQVPREDLVNLMRISALILQPSMFEGWSTSVQDAKALGRPVVCSDLEVLREQAPGALGFFAIEDDRALATILEKEWGGLVPGPDLESEKNSLRQEREFAEQFGKKLFTLCRAAAVSEKKPDPLMESVASDPITWEIQKKDEEIHRLSAECQKRLELIEKLLQKLRASDSPIQTGTSDPAVFVPGLENIRKEADPSEELSQRQESLYQLQTLIEEKELYVASLPIFNWAKLGRKVANIAKYHARKLRRPPARPAGTHPGTPAPPPDLTKPISDTKRFMRNGTSHFHRLESILYAPPFFCPQALWLKCRFLLTHPGLFFAGVAYRKWAKYSKYRLGLLYQACPSPMVPETFPAPQLKETQLPLISIVTPSYNQASFIEQTLRSVLDQDYPNLEYLVQDGNSRDGTVEILRRYGNRLHSWESAPDKGQSDAIIKGFSKSTGQIMAWLNSDDLLMPGSLRFVAEYFSTHPEVDVIYGHRVVIDENETEVGRWFLPAHDAQSLKWADYIPQETLFWRRSAWERTGGLDPSFHFALDWDLLLRFQQEQQKIQRLPYFLGCFRVHSSQKTSSVIHSTGEKEMEKLRLRSHGKRVSPKLIDLHVKSLLVKSAACSALWRFGIRL